jgi:Uma2 family endonuclease
MAVPLLKGPFTVDMYQRLPALGVLADDARVELIGGQVVEMSPIGDRRANCVRRLNRAFAPHVNLAVIDVQSTLVLGEHDAPQPDLSVLKPRADAYLRHPRAPDTLLVIEVADSSLAYDRDVKIPMYAAAGIPEVWLVNLPANRIDVYRQPVAAAYASVHSVSRGETLSPLLLPTIILHAVEIIG